MDSDRPPVKARRTSGSSQRRVEVKVLELVEKLDGERPARKAAQDLRTRR